MNKYDFEYFNQKYTSKLILILFLFFFILLFSSIFLSAKYLVKSQVIFILCLAMSAGFPLMIFRMKRSKIKKNGTAIIFDSYVKFDLDNIEIEIKYNDIKSYLIQNYNGTLINLVLKNGDKFNIATNNTYCETFKFDHFSQDLEVVLKEYIEKNNIEIIRKKPFFEKIWVFPFMIIFTVIIIILILYAIINGKHIPLPKLFLAIGPLLTIWAAYFNGKAKK